MDGIQHVANLMTLKLNFLWLSRPRLSNKLQDISLKLGNIVIKPSTSVRNLGIEFNQSMNMSTHVTSLCRSLELPYSQICLKLECILIRLHATMPSVRLLYLDLDYSNSLLYGITTSDLKRLQCIQNRGQPSLFFRPKSMIMLHHVLNNYIGLPVHSRIVF